MIWIAYFATAGLAAFTLASAADANEQPSSETAPSGVRQIEALLVSRDRMAVQAADLSRLQRALADFERELDGLLQEARLRSSQALAARAIRSERTRTEQLKQRIGSASGDALARELDRFDGEFPLRSLAPRPERSGPTPEITPQNVRARFVALNATLQTLSTVLGEEALPGINQLRGLLRKVEAISGPEMNEAREILATLPGFFYQLVPGVVSFASMNVQQAHSAADAYISSLDAAAAKIPAPPSQEQLADLRRELERITGELKSKADRLENERTRNTGSVRETAVQLSNGIGSETFKLLLLVFGAIFLLVMGMPVVYRNSPVAENLLKPEFLLQISTVFVLSATIIMLGSGGFIEKTQLPTLLAGISGYVLGQLGRVGGGGRVALATAPVEQTPKQST